MRLKSIYGILAICVSTLLLMQCVQGVTNAVVWQWQATLSTGDPSYGQDPEIYGYGTTQVAVWEEQVGGSADIFMKYSLADGFPGTWLFPLFQPATTIQFERHPAVSVTPSTGGSTEIHIVYEREDLIQGFLTWRVYHVYTNNFGAAWIGPVLLNTIARANAFDPAIVCTEDLAPGPGGGGIPGFLNQIVWSEETGFSTGIFQILYDAHIYDPTLLPARPYVGPTIIRTNPNPGIGNSCYKPEIASVDERSNVAAYDFPFAIVWEETSPTLGFPPFRYDIYYVDGTTTTSPGVPTTLLTVGSLGMINNPFLVQVDAREPDIAASQDYPAPGVVEQYYYHIVWVSKLWPGAGGGAYGNSVESSYACGITPWPGFAAFVAGLPPAAGPSPVQSYDFPTVASKLRFVAGPVFDSWFAWEDTSGPSPMDIYYTWGRHTVGGVPFLFMLPPPFNAIVPYAQAGSTESNPEFWNRNDPTRNLPPNSHLVFDMNPNLITTEIEYIDP